MKNLDFLFEDLDGRALQAFEERNKGYRILYETVLQTEEAADDEIIPILCNNLRLLTKATYVAIATYDKEHLELSLESLATADGKDIHAPGLIYNLSEDITNKYLAKIAPCDERLFSVFEFFSHAFPEEISKQKFQCFRIGFVYRDELIGLGGMVIPIESKLRLKDIVENFINMSSIIMQRVYTISELKKSRRRYDAIMADQADLICRFTRKGNILYANQVFCDYAGIDIADYYDKNIFETLAVQMGDVLSTAINTINIDNQLITQLAEFAINDCKYKLKWRVRGIFSESSRLLEYQALGREQEI